MMNKQLLVLALVLVTAACTPTSTAVPKLPSPESSLAATAVQPNEPALSATEAAGALWLQILSPQDEGVVNSQPVEVIGAAPPGSVVTVNDEILIVSGEAQFRTILALEEGPNLIEIVASDQNGNETSLLLTITYEP